MEGRHSSVSPSPDELRFQLFRLGLIMGILIVCGLGLRIGAVHVNSAQLFSIVSAPLFSSDASLDTLSLIVMEIRLPRLLISLTVGAALATAGVLMQGVFRNNLADP
ncbi:MAG: iron chelate uptake ABC transporter family permease subunit, partial [Myxococcota bacterium]